jgi:GNAT superfamily N-acetyltransferase
MSSQDKLLGDYIITTDREKLDVAAIHRYLSEESYWAKGIPFQTVQRSYDNSFVIGALHEGEQVGFARVVTDYATFGYLADVYVLPEHRGKGLSKEMMTVLMAEPWVAGLRRFTLATWDAHGLYAQFGFALAGRPDRLMEIIRPDLYSQSTSSTSE